MPISSYSPRPHTYFSLCLASDEASICNVFRFICVFVYVSLYGYICVCFFLYGILTEDKESSSQSHACRIMAISAFWWVTLHCPGHKREKKINWFLSHYITFFWCKFSIINICYILHWIIFFNIETMNAQNIKHLHSQLNARKVRWLSFGILNIQLFPHSCILITKRKRQLAETSPSGWWGWQILSESCGSGWLIPS